MQGDNGDELLRAAIDINRANNSAAMAERRASQSDKQADSLAAAAPPARRSIIVSRAGNQASPSSMTNLRRKQLERNNMQLAMSRQRLAAERNRLKTDLRNEVEANLVLRQTNCKLQTRLSALEERVKKLEVLSTQHTHAQLLADKEAVAASRAAAAEAAAAIRSPASTVSGAESDSPSTAVEWSRAETSTVNAASTGIEEVQDWFNAEVVTPQADSSASRVALLFTTPPRGSASEPEPECFSPQAHDLTILPPNGYAGRSRRRAALTASTNLVEPGLQSKMTQGMRKRNQLPARLGKYDDTWSADAASYMVHKKG
jgi:regulator of replication initiation timing